MSSWTMPPLLVVLAVVMAGVAVVTGATLAWVGAAAFVVAASWALVRRRGDGSAGFPTVEIHTDAEGPVAYLRLINLDAADAFSARLLRVTLEDSLSEPPPWSLPWQGVTGSELLLDREESRRLEIGTIVPGSESSPPALRLARSRTGGRGTEPLLPWPAVDELEEELGDLAPDLAGGLSRKIRAEIEIASERTGASRLVQLRVGIVPGTWDAEVQLVSIDLGQVRSAAGRRAA